ncbi:acetylglutamate kinase [Bacillus mojavensis]|jgi:acetylglutamate kinase|uniref:acetylglutamate kinase n=1 Tax=Bacillus TaxID=1386 RepID=UPI001E63BB42|nr:MULTISPECIES: acetylglutamate kinase [Bacillus]MCC2929343.1 acetylglutamate kinase [Bacillus sp. LBG-1-113]MCY9090803.1 acetylglutamate kinase [Bacillus mojavensis]MCY9187422.1 acetylglutamate kinase [Bacillus mojavensis]MEC1288979.1 acetylglutamate kinase [Bacillus mojavensis]MEC1613366.1 acetylglutamate kinase [Bacillus mojavensis]
MKKTIVFKCGGSVIRELSEEFFQNLKELMESGWKLAIVHGGGPEITHMLKRLNIKTEFSGGQRKTTKPVLEVAEMVLSGSVNKFFVAELAKHGLRAAGVSGKDGGLLEADYLDPDTYGEVGEIKKVNASMVNALMDEGIIPVIAPLSLTSDYKTLNVNADLAASAVAGALKADKLMFVTDVEGIMKEKQRLDILTPEEIQTLIKQEVITGGMIPKVNSALSALSDQVSEVMIVNGKGSFFSNQTFEGTKIVKAKEAVS